MNTTLMGALAQAPWGPALIGGALIGLASGLLMLALGRVAGISGVFHLASDPLVPPARGDRAWRWAFLLGLLGAGIALSLLMPMNTPSVPGQGGAAKWPLLLAAGLLVGWGTRLGSGCTSGHGVCGLARFSLRSLVAVLTFLAAGMLATYALRHLAGS